MREGRRQEGVQGVVEGNWEGEGTGSEAEWRRGIKALEGRQEEGDEGLRKS